eukprot:Rmarinus@m.26737
MASATLPRGPARAILGGRTSRVSSQPATMTPLSYRLLMARVCLRAATTMVSAIPPTHAHATTATPVTAATSLSVSSMTTTSTALAMGLALSQRSAPASTKTLMLPPAWILFRTAVSLLTCVSKMATTMSVITACTPALSRASSIRSPWTAIPPLPVPALKLLTLLCPTTRATFAKTLPALDAQVAARAKNPGCARARTVMLGTTVAKCPVSKMMRATTAATTVHAACLTTARAIAAGLAQTALLRTAPGVLRYTPTRPPTTLARSPTPATPPCASARTAMKAISALTFAATWTSALTVRSLTCAPAVSTTRPPAMSASTRRTARALTLGRATVTAVALQLASARAMRPSMVRMKVMSATSFPVTM